MQSRHKNKPALSDSTLSLAAWLAVGAATAWVIDRNLRRSVGSLAGETVLITGGSRGLGLLLAHEYARAGCRIALCARNEQELERARLQLQRAGAEVYTIRCDVTDRDQVEQMVRRVTQHYGQIDILVNNAGIIQVGPYSALTLHDFEQALDTMFWGIVYSTMAVVPQMQTRGHGRIVNITSIGGRVSVPHLLPYSSAKFAAVGFSEGIAAELRRDGITVTTVSPGLMRTGSDIQAIFKGQHQKEYGLFATVGSLPILSMDAERAASRIVEATRRGERELTLTGPAVMLASIHGLWPGLTVQLLEMVNRWLPESGSGGSRAKRGIEARAELPAGGRRIVDAVTVLNRRAAEEYQHVELKD
jgi:NAD(P)-dependent dehydrogenase (short-subunit alcohol dehydrogenase family)